MIDKHKKFKCIKSGLTLKSKQLCHVVSALLLTYYHERAMFKSAVTAWSGIHRSEIVRSIVAFDIMKEFAVHLSNYKSI